MSQRHILKIWTGYFDDVDSGRRPFAVSKDNRDYQVGDILEQHEFDPVLGEYTGRVTVKEVKCILGRRSVGNTPGALVMEIGPSMENPTEHVQNFVDYCFFEHNNSHGDTCVVCGKPFPF